MNNDFLIATKNILKSSRLKSRYSYKQLAELSGISDQTIRAYENNPNTDIPFNKLIYLLQILKVSCDDIVKLFRLFY